MITKITNYDDLVRERLISQYKNKERIEWLLTSFSREIQELENVYFDLLEKRSIDTAEGHQLDLIGTILGQSREGLSDSDYRIRLRAKTIQNTSFGEPERLITIFDMILFPNLIELQDCGLCGIVFGSDYIFTSTDQLKYIKNNLELATSATVRIDAIITFDATEPFAFEGDIFGLGFGDDLNPAIGGKLSYENLFLFPEFAFGNDEGSADINSGGFGTFDDFLVGGVFIS